MKNLSILFTLIINLIAKADEIPQVVVTGVNPQSIVFEVMRKGVQTGEFKYGYPKFGISHTVEVDSGVNGNLELAMIDEMIKIIRGQFKGQFYWDSLRQHKRISLDVRNKEQLEKFMGEEFFN